MPNHAMSEKRLSEDDLASLGAKSCIPIAIVGIGFRGPAEAKNVNRLLEMIVNGREAWSPIPAKRWNNKAFYHPDNARHGSVSCVSCGGMMQANSQISFVDQRGGWSFS